MFSFVKEYWFELVGELLAVLLGFVTLHRLAAGMWFWQSRGFLVLVVGAAIFCSGALIAAVMLFPKSWLTLLKRVGYGLLLAVGLGASAVLAFVILAVGLAFFVGCGILYVVIPPLGRWCQEDEYVRRQRESIRELLGW